MISVLTEYVYPAYETLYSYFVESYLPSCGESIACKDFPNGDVYYKYQIKSYTTTDLTAEEIHQIGLGEVDRIRAEMKKVINMTEFNGSFDEFLTFLRSDSQFYFTSEDLFSLCITHPGILFEELLLILSQISQCMFGPSFSQYCQ